jgi:5-methylcytosine-specific restriction endonuclease McrA
MSDPRATVRPMAAATPCNVCGDPCLNGFAVCQRTRECRRVYAQRRRAVPAVAAAQRDTNRRSYAANRSSNLARQAERRAALRVDRRKPCEVCGRLSLSLLGVCQETPRCRTEYNRRFRAVNRESLREYKRADRVANLERERERDRRRYASNPARREYQRRVRQAEDPKEVAERNRRYYEANRETLLEYARAYLRRPDRPCRYAAGGCTEDALPGSRSCRKHRVADGRRHKLARRARLAARQGMICPWCDRALPQDLAGTQVDHIIPVSRGGADDAWNLQLLHGRCNRAKGAKLTPAAVALALAHALSLLVAIPAWPARKGAGVLGSVRSPHNCEAVTGRSCLMAHSFSADCSLTARSYCTSSRYWLPYLRYCQCPLPGLDFCTSGAAVLY